MILERDVVNQIGDAKYVYDGGTDFYAAADATYEVVVDQPDVDSDQYGYGAKTNRDNRGLLKLRPQSVWAVLSAVYPSTHINPSRGAPLIGSAAKAMVVHGRDSSLLTIHNCCQTSLPTLKLGLDAGEFGDLEYTGVITTAKQMGESGALQTYAATGGTFGTPTTPDYLAAGDWEVDWNSGALAGTMLEACTITPEFSVKEVKMGGMAAVDFIVEKCQFSVSIRAAWDPLDLNTLLNDAASYTRGSRTTAGAGDLVLTSSLGHTFTLHSCLPDKADLRYAQTDVRSGAINFRGSKISGARISWTTPA